LRSQDWKAYNQQRQKQVTRENLLSSLVDKSINKSVGIDEVKTAIVNRKDNQYMYISLHDDTQKMDISQKISVRMAFTTIVAVIAASIAMEFGSYTSSEAQQISPEEKAKMCNPDNPSLNFVNSTESEICGIPASTPTSNSSSPSPSSQSESPTP
jgi:hypothetical protein